MTLTITFFQLIATLIRFIFLNSLIFEFLGHFMTLIDVFSNFICMILSYKYYNKIYLKICCVHSCCNHCWIRLSKKQTTVRKSLHIQVISASNVESNAKESQKSDEDE